MIKVKRAKKAAALRGDVQAKATLKRSGPPPDSPIGGANSEISLILTCSHFSPEHIFTSSHVPSGSTIMEHSTAIMEDAGKAIEGAASPSAASIADENIRLGNVPNEECKCDNIQ